MTLSLTESTILARMAATPRGTYCVTTGPGKRRGGPRAGVRELHAMDNLCKRGLAVELSRDFGEDRVRGPQSRIGGFVSVVAQITPEGRAAHANRAVRVCPKCGAKHRPPVNQRSAGRSQHCPTCAREADQILGGLFKE